VSRIAEVEHSKFLSVEREPVSIDHGDSNENGFGKRLYFLEKGDAVLYVFQDIGEDYDVIVLSESICRGISEKKLRVCGRSLSGEGDIVAIGVDAGDEFRLPCYLCRDKAIATADIEYGVSGVNIFKEEFVISHQMMLRMKTAICLDSKDIDDFSKKRVETEEGLNDGSEKDRMTRLFHKDLLKGWYGLYPIW
jgi:hypothetical protein